MFARHVSVRLKANSLAEFTRTIENEVLPVLRIQKGFEGEITLAIPGGTEAVGISLWDKKENAEAYQGGDYLQVQKALAKVIEGTPAVRTYEVTNSTLRSKAAGAAA
jgi:hypothetical protein